MPRTAPVFLITYLLISICCSKPDEPKKAESNSSIDTTTTLKTVDFKKVDDLVHSKMKELKIPGMSIAVLHKGKVVYKNCYGLANVEHSIPVLPKSPFKIASLTKPFTAVATMQLVEKGKIALEQPVSLYLNGLPKNWHQITVRQLLSHTSGLADYFQSPDWSWRNSWRLDLNHEEFIKMNEKSPMEFEPGEGMRYCNTNYYLLGMLIEKVSGQRYGDYLAENIFKPLNMSHSRLDNAQALILNRVSGYTLDKEILRNAEFTSDTWAYSEGGVVTTAGDLAKFDSALYTDKLLKRSSIEQLWSPSKLSDGSDGIIGDNGAGKPNYYGLGWFISDYKNHKLILAGGNKPGYTCIFFRFIKDDLSVIVLSNLSSSPMYTIAGEIAEMYLTN